MKKILSLLLTICLLVGSNINVFASDQTAPNATEMSVPITYTQESSYILYIPEVINLDANGYVFEASQVDIKDSEVVVVTAPDYVYMTNESGVAGNLMLYGVDSRGVAVFENGNLTSTTTMYGQFSGFAGYYTGTAEFKIELQNK